MLERKYVLCLLIVNFTFFIFIYLIFVYLLFDNKNRTLYSSSISEKEIVILIPALILL